MEIPNRSVMVALALFFPMLEVAQDAPRLAFDVASVKRNQSAAPADSNFPLGPGNAYRSNGGRFWATGFPLSMYINFAYKLTPAQIQQMSAQLPAWATTDGYDVEGRVQNDPGKDGMRALMRSLLRERFKLAVHEETKDMPVAALVPIRQGKLGPMIQPHPAGTPCPNDIAPGGVTPRRTISRALRRDLGWRRTYPRECAWARATSRSTSSPAP